MKKGIKGILIIVLILSNLDILETRKRITVKNNTKDPRMDEAIKQTKMIQQAIKDSEAFIDKNKIKTESQLAIFIGMNAIEPSFRAQSEKCLITFAEKDATILSLRLDNAINHYTGFVKEKENYNLLAVVEEKHQILNDLKEKFLERLSDCFPMQKFRFLQGKTKKFFWDYADSLIKSVFSGMSIGGVIIDKWTSVSILTATSTIVSVAFSLSSAIYKCYGSLREGRIKKETSSIYKTEMDKLEELFKETSDDSDNLAYDNQNLSSAERLLSKEVKNLKERQRKFLKITKNIFDALWIHPAVELSDESYKNLKNKIDFLKSVPNEDVDKLNKEKFKNIHLNEGERKELSQDKCNRNEIEIRFKQDMKHVSGDNN